MQTAIKPEKIGRSGSHIITDVKTSLWVLAEIPVQPAFCTGRQRLIASVYVFIYALQGNTSVDNSEPHVSDYYSERLVIGRDSRVRYTVEVLCNRPRVQVRMPTLVEIQRLLYFTKRVDNEDRPN